jgi:glutathione S-transferase
MTNRTIYHLTTATQWDEAVAARSYRVGSLDEVGFIHFSNADQVERTFAKFYRDVPDLVLLTVDADALDPSALVDEPGDPGSPVLFPHLYGALPIDAVTDVAPYPGPGGSVLS